MLGMFDKISLSRRTIIRRVKEIAADIEDMLTGEKKKILTFSSLAIDESSDISDSTQMEIFIRVIDKSFNITEELLSVQAMKDTVTGFEMYEEVKKAVWKLNLPLERLVICRLSKEKMLERFYYPREDICTFLEKKGKFVPELKNDNWICDLAFLVDITTHLKDLNLKDLNLKFKKQNRVNSATEANFNLFGNLFTADVEKVRKELQMDLIEPQSDEYFRHFYGMCFARRHATMFGKTYKYEQLFSRIKIIKSKTRSRFIDIHLEDKLRVATSQIPVNIEKLMENVQYQVSHQNL
uniref:DUF4371 domain-containing protein n=1 Tax=Octopus bimaculoides TaxID=37653 RepID=A0A0L8IC94_OCTBM